MACTNVHSNAMIAWRSKHSILPIRKGTLQPSVYIHYHIWYIGISHAFSNFYICLCTPYFDIRCTYVYIRLRIHTRARLQQVTCTRQTTRLCLDAHLDDHGSSSESRYDCHMTWSDDLSQGILGRKRLNVANGCFAGPYLSLDVLKQGKWCLLCSTGIFLFTCFSCLM